MTSFMQNFLRGLTIKKKLSLMSLPITAALVVCVCLILSQQLYEGLAAQTTNNFVKYSQLLDDVAHNHAVERGLTAGFMASGGRKGGEKLAAQRENTENTRAAFKDFYASVHRRDLPEAVQAQLLKLKNALDGVPKLQARVDQVSPDAKPFQTFSQINQLSLDSIDYLNNMIEDSKVSGLMNRFHATLWLKERAGQERGALNGVFVRGVFSYEDVEKINLFIRDQSTQRDIISRNVSKEEFARFESLVGGESSQRVTAMRQAFYQGRLQDFKVSVDANEWFDQSTARIKQIKAYADQTALKISTLSKRTGMVAWLGFAVTLLLSLFFVAGLWFLNRIITQQALDSISVLVDGIEDVRNNCDFSKRVEIVSQDELGNACVAFNTLIARLQSAIKSSVDVVTKVARGEFDDRVTLEVSGDLSNLAKGINGSASKVEITMQELERVMNALEEGDFTARMSDQIEGRMRVQVDKAMASMELAIESVGDVMQSMNEGDFSARVSADLKGSLSGLKENVNWAVSNLSSAIVEISTVLRAQQDGDYAPRVEGAYNGELAILKDRINESMGSISGIISDIAVVFQEVSQGNYAPRVGADMRGELRQMKSDINGALSSVDSAIEEVVGVCESQAEGKLELRINGDYSGQIQALKTALNHSGEQTEKVFSQISRVMAGLNIGDFSQRVDTNLPGAFGLLAKSINGSLNNLQEVMRDIRTIAEKQRDGFLGDRLGGVYQGEFLSISESVNDSLTKISAVISDVQNSTATTSNSCAEQLGSSSSMSERTEKQAAALEEVAASMEEVGSSLEQTDDQCSTMVKQFEKVNSLIADVRDTAKDTVTAMETMKSSTGKIANITGMIEELAFQTNLLALNAAVEAARAGEQGKGFAVVASEVRNLALKSSSAANEIKTLIEESEENADNSFRLAENSQTNLQTITTSLAGFYQKTIDISRAAKEQSIGVRNVNEAIASLDALTQANASMVVDSVASAQQLSDQSTNLEDKVGFFKV